MTSEASVLQRVASLNRMAMPDLKKMWKELFGSAAPNYDKRFMIKRLAYRIQELAYGGLSKTAEQRLRAGQIERKTNTPKRVRQSAYKPAPGTQLIREWQGVDYCTTALENGFEFQGQHFRSLSAVARAITGTRWNGLAFFGVKKAGQPNEKQA
ncbi:MAG: DUF2924 domain-containing protein [Magnetococcales bacterium]|nr:DUF2924 domain-containing protein [Magnetococcales bacterium]